jgi:predicted GNAT family acetyltransferase
MSERFEDEDHKLDETLEESFPASDAPANTPETGIRIGTWPAAAADVVDNAARSRFELLLDGETAFLVYERTSDTLTLVHTEVPGVLRGRRVGDLLVKAAVDSAHAAGLRIVVVCPFAREVLRRSRATAE